jgi:hypothetical protein
VTQSLQAKLLIVAVFVIGGLTGAVVADVYETQVGSGADADVVDDTAQSDPDRERPRPPRFEDFLELDETQREQLSMILRQSRERYRELQAVTRPMYRDLTIQSQNEIRAILDDTQRARYEAWIERVESRNRNGGSRNNDRERDDASSDNRDTSEDADADADANDRRGSRP